MRQHYIPQFILRNFCHDSGRKEVYFFKTGEQEYTSEYVSDVFMEEYLYATAEDPVETEKALARFEMEMAPIFKKFSQDSEIRLTREENEHFRMFLSLLSFRSANTRDAFANMTEESRILYGIDQRDVDAKDLWLHNVRFLSRHRTIKDVLSDPEVNPVLKLFITQDFLGFYTCLLERRGSVDFHISDCYPLVWCGEVVSDGKPVTQPIYYFYPISDSRVIVLVTRYIQDIPRDVARLNCDKLLKGPKATPDGHLLFRPEKVYIDEVEWIDQMIIDSARTGIVVRDPDRCSIHL